MSPGSAGTGYQPDDQRRNVYNSDPISTHRNDYVRNFLDYLISLTVKEDKKYRILSRLYNSITFFYRVY